ncbi:N-acetyltransferase GCN5 [Rhodococcus ruber BKS 20-38]|uniref:N-acetyltransferase GCN5 n=1 Tax=Rhodococcus ruber BKS 20-38 TaxID=1278076 RepID=M2Y6X8_9NOCA|nr:GNAT family N-acetyltransferase [Rhodococcus ruber]EME50692.1 N-acetyltransferase GCN5 [Rhodococcus ruber BKS 20-38]
MTEIRPAEPTDVDRATRTLARAFADYPFTRHTVDARDHLRRVEELQRLYLTEIGLRCGRVWVSDDATAVAVWTTPESTGITEAFARIAGRVAELSGDRAAAATAADEALAPLRPREPAWFLATVAVDPDRQGAGLGGAVLAPGLREAREAGVPAYLETSSERNVAFYRRLGFDVVGTVDLPGDGPRTWTMIRK